MAIINSKEDWWNVLEQHWENIEGMIFTFHPSVRTEYDVKITAEAAERACETARRLIATDPKTESLENRVTRCRDTKNQELVTILNETWFGIPESTESRYLPSFFVLCDLCSEIWVFDEIQEENLLDKNDTR